MIRSMTGFGTADVQCEHWAVRAEVRTVNHRDLQLSLRLPDAFHLKESELQRVIEKKVRRGHLYLSLTCRPATDEAATLVDHERLTGYVAALRALAETEGLPLQMDLAELLRLPGALVDVTGDAEMRELLWPRVVEAVETAVDALMAMREAEGAHLRGQLHEILESIGALVNAIDVEQEGLVAAYRDRLKERVTKLLAGTDVAVNEESLAREVAFFADRADVSEEIARLRSHLAQFVQALDGDGAPVGRRMEFLGQEMLREASTMAAKIPAGGRVGQVLELKSEIERLREQARNVE